MQNWLNGAKRPMPAFAAVGADFSAPEQNTSRLWQLAGSKNPHSANRSGSSSHYSAPQKPGVSRRALLAMVLTILVAPVGIAMMWYKSIFEVRGRVLLTVLGIAIMTAVLPMMMDDVSVIQLQPTAVKATLRAPLPTDATLNALSNMEELLAGVENKPVVNTDLNEVTGMTVAETVAEVTPEPEDPMQTVVYAVSSGAKYYHKAAECKGQVNRRSITAAQAVSEGLKPCGRCNPVSP